MGARVREFSARGQPPRGQPSSPRRGSGGWRWRMADKGRLGCPLAMADESVHGSARGWRGRGGGADGGISCREWCRSSYYRLRCSRRRCCRRALWCCRRWCCCRRCCRRWCRRYRGRVLLRHGGSAAGPRRNQTLEIARQQIHLPEGILCSISRSKLIMQPRPLHTHGLSFQTARLESGIQPVRLRCQKLQLVLQLLIFCLERAEGCRFLRTARTARRRPRCRS